MFGLVGPLLERVQKVRLFDISLTFSSIYFSIIVYCSMTKLFRVAYINQQIMDIVQRLSIMPYFQVAEYFSIFSSS